MTHDSLIVYSSLVRKGQSIELMNQKHEEFAKQWGGDGFRYEQIVTAPDGKVFSKKTWRIISKPCIDEWTRAVNHHMEHGA